MSLNSPARTLRMPAEWEPHAACWMGWPQQTLWKGDIDAVERDYAAVAQAIARFEPVRILADPSVASRARQMLGNEIKIIEVPMEDAWLRDSGPAFVRTEDGGLAGVHWRFNGWGGATPVFEKDADLGRFILDHVGVPRILSALAMEGGALAVDGEGTLLATDTVTFNDNRNPGLSRAHAEAEFARTLGIEKVIWLPGNPYEFGTDGHVDGIACFVRPGVVMFEQSSETSGASFEIAEANRAALEGQTDAKGRAIEIVTITDAPRDRSDQGKGDWGYSNSYINFYIANGAVIMPGFGLPSDAAAKTAVMAAFPEHEVVQVDISKLASGGGGIHCITQQQPTAAE